MLGFHHVKESQYINSIIKVKVIEVCAQESIHYQFGNTSRRKIILVIDDFGIQAKFLLWEEYLAIANLFEEGDTLYIKQGFLVPNDLECFTLEYGPETIIFCEPLKCEQEILPSQKGSSKMLYVTKDKKGMLDCSMYPEKLKISELQQNMTNITIAGQVVSVDVRKLIKGDGLEMVTYELRVQDESAGCSIVVVEPYKGGAKLYCGQFVLLKNLHISSR